MPAGITNFEIDQNANFATTVFWRDGSGNLVDLTGFSAEMMIKNFPLNNPSVFTLSTANAKITLGGSAGTIALSMSEADTLALVPDTYVYDLLLTDNGGFATRLLEGNVVVNAAVTI